MLVALAAVVPAAIGAPSSQSVSLDLGVFQQLNVIRSQHGLAPLRLDDRLTEAADSHSEDMVANGYFSHDSSDGAAFSDRLASFYPQGSAHYWAVGENIFWSSGPPSASRGVEAWMASPPHRANILNPNWRVIGIGAVTAADAPGTFAGLNVTVITADFGVRR
jgi:uncharacterized protein YkwD